jgi:hypothetical protein
MAHFVEIRDMQLNPDLFESIGQFVDQKPEGHQCIPECHSIGGEVETGEMYSPILGHISGRLTDDAVEECIELEINDEVIRVHVFQAIEIIRTLGNLTNQWVTESFQATKGVPEPMRALARRAVRETQIEYQRVIKEIKGAK